MTRSELLFYAIDVLFHPFQNYRKYPNITREQDFAYDESKPEDCRAEFYYDPLLIANNRKLPVIVNIHGGGFVKGDKKHRRSLCKRFASHGYFTMNINYSLSPKSVFPTAIRDCINAINYLKTVEEKYNLDLNNVCITGDSSGAYYATQTVACANDEELRLKIGAPEFIVKPSVLVSFCAPYDIVTALSITKLPFNLIWDMGTSYLGKEFALKKDFSNLEDYELLKELSPTNYVNKNWCPTFLVMSERDVFCKGHGDILKQKLIENQVVVETFSSTKLIDNHCFHMNMFTKISKECFKQVFEFIKKHHKE